MTTNQKCLCGLEQRGVCFVRVACSLQVTGRSLLTVVAQEPRLRDQPPSQASPVAVSEQKEGLTLEPTHTSHLHTGQEL